MAGVRTPEIGLRIKERRQECGLSLRELARRTELTASFLSQVERGQTNISLVSLHKVADALRVPTLYFLTNGPRASSVVRADARRKLILPDSPITYELLTPDAARKMEVYCARMAPGTAKAARPLREPTEQWIYVLSGALTVSLQTEEQTLYPGDTLYFDGTLLTRLACASTEEEAVWITVITPPVF